MNEVIELLTGTYGLQRSSIDPHLPSVPQRLRTVSAARIAAEIALSVGGLSDKAYYEAIRVRSHAAHNPERASVASRLDPNAKRSPALRRLTEGQR